MRRYRFFFLDGKISEGCGTNVANAFTHLGYGGGAITSCDYYEESGDPSNLTTCFHILGGIQKVITISKLLVGAEKMVWCGTNTSMA